MNELLLKKINSFEGVSIKNLTNLTSYSGLSEADGSDYKSLNIIQVDRVNGNTLNNLKVEYTETDMYSQEVQVFIVSNQVVVCHYVTTINS